MEDDDLRRLDSFEAGKVLIERGKPGTGLFVLLDGTLVVEAPEGTPSSARAR